MYGSEFEIQLKNKLTQKVIAKECEDWIRRKARFRSNASKAPMQPFACISTKNEEFAYMPLHGFTAVDQGYQPGDAVSNFITKFDDVPSTQTWLNLFNQIWNDKDKLTDVTEAILNNGYSVTTSQPLGSSKTTRHNPCLWHYHWNLCTSNCWVYYYRLQVIVHLNNAL